MDTFAMVARGLASRLRLKRIGIDSDHHGVVVARGLASRLRGATNSFVEVLY